MISTMTLRGEMHLYDMAQDQLFAYGLNLLFY